MTQTLRMLGIDRTRWVRVGPTSLLPAMATVLLASGLIALNRFGGALVDAPRSFMRLALVGVWGWLGLGSAIWLGAALLSRSASGSRGSTSRPRETLVVVGLAHLPILALGVVILVAAGLLQWLGPGLVATVFVLAFWFPAGVTMATAHVHGLAPFRALSVVALPYLAWLGVVARHMIGQVQHLL